MVSKLFFKDLSQKMIDGCKIMSDDGVTLYAPDALGYYPGMWTRDFSYMIEYASDLILAEDIEAGISHLLSHSNSEGWIVDWVRKDGTPSFSPVGKPNLDNAAFITIAAWCYLDNLGENEKSSCFQKWESSLNRGLELISLSESGLVYNSDESLHSPYGFTDCVCKTGELFFESLLFWRACGIMEKGYMIVNNHEMAVSYREKKLNIESSITNLFDNENGAFFAASDSCKQIDIWGNFYFLFIDFPLTKIREKVVKFLDLNFDHYTYRGGIRHLLIGEYWEKLLIDIPKEEYQNGAFWSTPVGWAIKLFNEIDVDKSKILIKGVKEVFERNGVFECWNTGYFKTDNYVVSAVNVYGGMKEQQPCG